MFCYCGNRKHPVAATGGGFIDEAKIKMADGADTGENGSAVTPSI